MNFEDLVLKNGDETIKHAIALIRTNIEKKQPYCILRYGDGEALILKNESLNKTMQDRFEKLFGYIPSEEYYKTFRNNYIDSLSCTDIASFQTNEWLNNISKWFYYEMIDKYIKRDTFSIPIHVTNIIFENHLSDIIKPIDDIILICCRIEAKEIIHKLTGATVRDVIIIPSEYKFRKCFDENTKTSQIPERMNDIITNEIPQKVKKGTIVLIGSGPTKVMYSNMIKTMGGIAIDIGSTFDFMCGYITRGVNKGTKIKM